MSQNIKKSYRDKLLGGKATEGREVELDGMKIRVKFPTRGSRKEIYFKSTTESGQVDGTLLETWATIELCEVAETGEKLFGDEDFDIIQGKQIGGDFDKLAGEALMALLGIDPDAKDQKLEEAKNDPKNLPST